MSQERAKAAYLTLQINSGENTDAEELDFLTRQLRNEIQEGTDAESVDLLKGEPAPEGAKVVDPITLGALAVAILPNAVPKLVEVLSGWLMRGENRKITIKTKVGDKSVELEYSPSAMSEVDFKRLTEILHTALTPNKPA